MESTRPIRALTRGLDTLTVLNSRDGATVSEISQEIRLPRTTVYRILETLCNAGFVIRDSADDRYRLTIQVRSLSKGFHEAAWVPQIAKPCLAELCRDIAWPLSIATLSNSTMILRETTDHRTPLAVERFAAGHRAPLLDSATGRTYLAFSRAAARDGLLDALSRSNKDEDKLARSPRAELNRQFADIKAQGFAAILKTRRLIEEASIAVPVLSDDRVLAALAVRFTTGIVPLKAGMERFLPKLRQCAAKISIMLSEQLSVGGRLDPVDSAHSA
jgi:IclR family transcriptional regulator, mhp operon transcriptional activator